MKRRRLGGTGVSVGEVGLELAWGEGAEPLVRRAADLGCTLFFVKGEVETARAALEKIVPEARMLSRSAAGTLVLRGPGIHLSGIRVADVEGFHRLPETERGDFAVVPYNLMRQEASGDLLPELRRAGMGVVVEDALADGALSGPVGHTPPGAMVEKYRFLVRPGRTLTQAAIQFVLADDRVSCALAGAEEALTAPAAEPLTRSELQRIRAIWKRRK